MIAERYVWWGLVGAFRRTRKAEAIAASGAVAFSVSRGAVVWIACLSEQKSHPQPKKKEKKINGLMMIIIIHMGLKPTRTRGPPPNTTAPRESQIDLRRPAPIRRLLDERGSLVIWREEISALAVGPGGRWSVRGAWCVSGRGRASKIRGQAAMWGVRSEAPRYQQTKHY